MSTGLTQNSSDKGRETDIIAKEEKKSEHLQTLLQWLSTEQKDEMFELLQQDKKKREMVEREKSIIEKRKLNKAKASILKDLKENHVKVEEDVRYMWRLWKKIHIDLPKIGEFKWFNFDFFVTKEKLPVLYDREHWKRRDKEAEQKNKQLCSEDDIRDLVKALNSYMHECWVDIDKGINLEMLERPERWEWSWCETWNCIKELVWLDGWYHLSGAGNALCCNYTYFHFINHCTFDTRLLFKLSK